MAKVEITESLFMQIDKKFKQKSAEVLKHLKSLESFPKKGKILGTVGGILIKELKYEGFRFYFITDGFKLKYANKEEVIDLLLRFVRMSDKKHQQQTINEIKYLLRTIGTGAFE
jgi:alpha-acetolactate decarboxylase